MVYGASFISLYVGISICTQYEWKGNVAKIGEDEAMVNAPADLEGSSTILPSPLLVEYQVLEWLTACYPKDLGADKTLDGPFSPF